jgi:antirestriction protein ArdC
MRRATTQRSRMRAATGPGTRAGLTAIFGRKRFGDEGYAREELVAELGAAFLCADLGLHLEDRDDHAAYIGSWLKVLKDDRGRSSPLPPMRSAPPITCMASSPLRSSPM